jgi:hypothetical protein
MVVTFHTTCSYLQNLSVLSSVSLPYGIRFPPTLFYTLPNIAYDAYSGAFFRINFQLLGSNNLQL